MIKDESPIDSMRLLESIPEAVVICDDDYRITQLSPWAGTMFGYRQDELLGHSISQLLATREKMNRKALGVLLGAELNRPHRPRRSVVGRHKDGSEFRLEITRGQMQDDADTLKVFVLREMCEQDKALAVVRFISRELEKRCDELEQFSYLASHDLKEPLRSISSFVDILEAATDISRGDDSTMALQFIRNGVERMRALVHGLLDYSRLGQTSVAEMVDLAEVMHEVQLNLAAALQEPDVELTVADLPRVRGVRLDLVCLLQNLVSNAIKYRRPDIPLAVAVSAETKDGHCEIHVRDNGCGIPTAEQERVFKPFHRLPSLSRAEGSGLGLAHCRKIAERHNGLIKVRAAEPFGSVFTVSLPVPLVA